MRTFLLTWNPSRWDWDEGVYDSMVLDTEAGTPAGGNWSTGLRKSGIKRGDEGFLVRQHEDRGVVAHCVFTSDIYSDEMFDGTDGTANYADVEWDVVLPIEDRLPIEALVIDAPGVSWDRLQGSGVEAKGADANSTSQGLVSPSRRARVRVA